MAQDPYACNAAGSLRAVMLDLGAVFEKTEGVKLAPVFAPRACCGSASSAGEAADVFASADMGHPQRLAATG